MFTWCCQVRHVRTLIFAVLLLNSYHHAVQDDAVTIADQNETCIVLNPFSDPESIECTFPHTPVTRISLLETKMGDYTLNSALCDTFPHIQNFDGGESHINGLTNDAFHSCLNLTHVQLSGNQIAHLEKDTFSRSFNVEKIDLSQNQLGSLLTTAFLNAITDEPTANLTDSLTEVDLSENMLRIFSTITVSHLKNLEVLRLHGNYPLKGFDVRFILERLTNLRELTFCPKHELKLNLAEKERLIRMYFAVANFKARKVETDRKYCRNVFG